MLGGILMLAMGIRLIVLDNRIDSAIKSGDYNKVLYHQMQQLIMICGVLLIVVLYRIHE